MISVIIPACNRNDLLAECLHRLAPGAQTISSEKFEVIVTDDGRKEPCKDMIAESFPWARWTAGPGRGPAANRNHGAALARGEWLIFVDDDCLPEPELIEAYEREFQQLVGTGVTVLEGPTFRVEDPPSLLWVAPHNPVGGACISANFGMTRTDFDDVGRFDERFPHAAVEDTEFFARVKSGGGVTKFVRDAVVHHPLRQLSNPTGLANKWEGKAILSMDNGAPPMTVMWRLPLHVLRVIQSRFRNQPWTRDNCRAAWMFMQEWLIVLVKTPIWVRKWSRRPRSNFWMEEIAKSGSPPKFGF